MMATSPRWIVRAGRTAVLLSLSLAGFFLIEEGIRADEPGEVEESLTDQRIWRNTEGKIVRAKLIAFEGEGGGASGVIVDGKVQLLVASGRILTLPLDELSPEDRKFILEIAGKSGTGGVEPGLPGNHEIQLAIRTEKGTYRPFFAPVYPTFGQPRVIVTKIEVQKLDWSDEAGGQCAFTAKGKFYSALANGMIMENPPFLSGRLYVNEGETPAALLPFQPSPDQGKAAIDGTFDVTIEGIKVTEGFNTWRFAMPDPVSSIEGAAVVTFQARLESKDGVPRMKVTDIKPLEPESSGEIFPLFLIVKGVSAEEAKDLRLRIGEGDNRVFGSLKPVSNKDGAAMVNSVKTRQPLSIALLPSRREIDLERAKELMKEVDGLEAKGSMTDHVRFLAGYSRGVFFNGADLLTGDGVVVEGGAQLSPETMNLELQLQWEKKGKRGQSFNLALPPGYFPEESAETGVGASPELLWQIAKLYREKDPKTADAVLALLTPDLDLIGLDSFRLDGWRGEFFGKIAEAIHELNEELKDEPPLEHGFYIGMAVAAAARIDLPPVPGADDPGEPWVRPSKLEVLKPLLEFLKSAGR